MQASEDHFGTVCLSGRIAVLASMAHVSDGLVSSSLSYLEVLDLITDLDNDTGTFVTSAFSTQLRHLWQSPIVHHEVNIRQTKASGVELDEAFERP